MVHGMARGHDRMETTSVESSGRLGGGRTRVNGRFGWFGPQNHRAGRFPGLGLKTGGEPGAAVASRRRARGVIAKLASRRSKVVKAACPSDARIKTWTKMPLRG